ncbi:DUF4177 domain-containing protein [Paracoccus sp. (in: a-proteobacteria)]|uniref:DUF4177 domain-containing protein n=1 Tax=Paracoccus sp. TaxID=267 RepID=UPI002896E59C|nr:DUF4177 domain-containing protein [Paracoccus sp. (in: a-proteobacteria)]
MQLFEYTVVPAPDRGEKGRGSKTATDRFSQAFSTALNEMAQQGWEYLRAETLPTEERSGLTSRTMVYHNVLVFRRSLTAVNDVQPAAVSAPSVQPIHAPEPAPQPVEPAITPAPEAAPISAPTPERDGA